MDNELQKKLQAWQIEAPRAGLSEDVIARATLHPQKVFLLRRADQFMAYVFGNWQTGLAYKCASLALCAMIGFSSGLAPQQAIEVDVAALAFGLTTDGGGL